MSEPDGQDSPRHHGLLFRWMANEGAAKSLLMWSGLVAAGLTVIFLLFEVVYPTPSRRPHTTQRIILLDPAQPKARALIAAVTDRNFLLLAPNANAAPRLADLRPVFSPGFKDFQLQLKDLPETGAASSTMPRLFSPERSPLPPVVGANAVTKAAKANSLRLMAVPSAGLEERKLLHDLEPLPAGSPALGEINAQFRVAVGPEGRIITAVSLMDESAEAGAAASRAFHEAMDTLRFEPQPGSGPQWGVITFRWKEVKR